jgi:AcrR family transcriptional regulator
MPKQAPGRNAKSGIARRRAAAKAEASEHYKARRQDVVQAAAAVFRAKGFASATIDDVARAAGLDRATLYYYIGNKDELFRDVVIDALVDNIKMAEEISRGNDSPSDKLKNLVKGMMTSYAQFYPHLYVFIREDPTTIVAQSQSDVDILDLQRRFDRALIEIVREGVKEGLFRPDIPPRLAAYGIIGMLNWTHRWFDPNGPIDSDDVSEAFATLAVEGLLQR